jgi:murein DD-endopeptidase MepM/ murein hydrolase activator NlpD
VDPDGEQPWDWHAGIDLDKLPDVDGDDVYAAEAGVVVVNGEDPPNWGGYGKVIVLAWRSSPISRWSPAS